MFYVPVLELYDSYIGNSATPSEIHPLCLDVALLMDASVQCSWLEFPLVIEE